VTDYGVRLTVRVGILSQLACAPFRVVILYTVSSLRAGRFHRPFQGFSAPRYVSTTYVTKIDRLPLLVLIMEYMTAQEAKSFRKQTRAS
jgi:hypothetical protein